MYGQLCTSLLYLGPPSKSWIWNHALCRVDYRVNGYFYYSNTVEHKYTFVYRNIYGSKRCAKTEPHSEIIDSEGSNNGVSDSSVDPEWIGNNAAEQLCEAIARGLENIHMNCSNLN